MSANCCGKNPCSAKLQSAGMSLRLVRSPAPPKITMMQGSPLRCGAEFFTVLLLTSVSGSSSSSRMRLSLPHPKTSRECVRVIAQPGTWRWMFEFFSVATTQHDVFCLQGIAKLARNLAHVLFPLLSAQPFETTNTDILFV